MKQNIVWFDLAVRDLPRAKAFYEAVLETTITEDYPGVGVFHHDDSCIGGCLHLADEPPAAQGALLYFNATGRLEAATEAVVAHGGTVLQPPHSLGPHGRRAVVLDSEGNRIALHAENV